MIRGCSEGRSHIGEVDIDEVGQGDGEHHGSEPTLQAMTRNAPSAEQAADGESDDAHGAIGEAHGFCAQPQASGIGRIEEEGVGNLHELSFREAEEEHEKQGCEDMGLGEEGLQGQPEVIQQP